MNFSLTTLLILASVLQQPVLAQTPKAPTKSNIVFIYADDLRYGYLGCYRSAGAGNKNKMPNIDVLAAGGMRFIPNFTRPCPYAARYERLC